MTLGYKETAIGWEGFIAQLQTRIVMFRTGDSSELLCERIGNTWSCGYFDQLYYNGTFRGLNTLALNAHEDPWE